MCRKVVLFSKISLQKNSGFLAYVNYRKEPRQLIMCHPPPLSQNDSSNLRVNFFSNIIYFHSCIYANLNKTHFYVKNITYFIIMNTLYGVLQGFFFNCIKSHLLKKNHLFKF